MRFRNSSPLPWILGCALVALMVLTPVMAQDTQQSNPSTPIKNLQFQAAEIRSVLNFLADYGNVNVVVAPDVTGNVTIRLQNVQWRAAMDIIGRTYDLAVVDDTEAGYIRVLRSETYRTEITEQRKHDVEQHQLVDLETKIVKISNSVASELEKTVESLMSDRGKATADKRSNSLILQEVPDHLPIVLDYITKLDMPSRQIKISAQLLEISSESMQELGINWMASGAYTTESGRVYNQSGEVLGNLGTTPLGRYTLNASGTDWTLDGFVEAIVQSGKGKIIAHPEITTVENKEARIQMGSKVPIKQFDESGNVVIKFEEIGTILIVTPHITAENQVLMHLKPERSTFEFDPAGVIINTNNAETNVIVNNGQTAVIGGLTTQDETEVELGVPLLKDIPILGNLFKFSRKQTESKDLVIFVTPTIVDSDLAMKP